MKKDENRRVGDEGDVMQGSCRTYNPARFRVRAIHPNLPAVAAGGTRPVADQRADEDKDGEVCLASVWDL